MKFGKLTASNHFIERYKERVDNSDEVSKLYLEELFEDSDYEYLCFAEYVDKKMYNYVLCKIDNRNFVVIVNEAFQSLITIFEVDFGFSKEVNDFITDKTIEEGRIIALEASKVEAEIADSKVKIESEIYNTEYRIDSLKRELKILEDKHKSLKSQLETLVLDYHAIKESANRVFYKIIYSINYHFEKIARK